MVLSATGNNQLINLQPGFFRRWYHEHGRAFPWRQTGISPFGILVAEMMLRKTKAENVAAVWPSFIEEYKTPQLCLAASEDSLSQKISRLGLGRIRAHALKQIGYVLVNSYRGRVPDSFSDLTALPHVGIYTANAIMCFAFGQKVPIVDVNILRLFSRLTGNDYGRDNRRAPLAWELGRQILPNKGVTEHNYGLLDFCSAICTSIDPRHDLCALVSNCSTYNQIKPAVKKQR